MYCSSHLTSLETLEKEDFKLFYSSFEKLVAAKIPGFSNLLFLGKDDEISDAIVSPMLAEKIQHYFNGPASEENYCRRVDNAVLFTVPAQKQKIMVVVTGVDSYFAEHVSKDWLEELSGDLEQMFVHIKKAGVDLETGLPNSLHFHATLQEVEQSAALSILLVEVYPRARSAQEAKIHTAKTVRSLRNCLNGKASLFYLGHHVFGIISTTMESSRFAALAKRVLLWLRRDGFRRIHLGLGRGGQEEEGRNFRQSRPHLHVLDQAGFALDRARKRGPFSLCDYHCLRHPHKHPLRKPSRALLAKFRRKWKDVDSFSILELQPSSPGEKNILAQRLPAKHVVHDNHDLYVFLPDIPPNAALVWWEKYVEDNAPGLVQVGIAYYPHVGCSKSATVFHCRKALNHARFFGPEGRAIFDAVSLNVSGDIYYAEGDLTSAVAEYRAGIACEQNNVNLLNSLGVAYADMDKHREARLCFEKVLNLDSDNFMALYNFGLEAELNGRYEDAYTFLEKVYVLLDDDKDGGQELGDDIRYRYGRLCSRTGRHQKAIEVLLGWYEHEPFSRMKDKALPHLGQSYYGLGQYGRAVTWLQKALQYDEFDSESMGLLGHCYLILRQGDEIALALCQKSTELSPDKSFLRLYLARAQIACRRYDEAQATLRLCLLRKATKTEAQLLMCLNYYRKGMEKRAVQWLEKVHANASLEPGLAREAHQLDTQIRKQTDEVFNEV